jgi:hypothetical protein
VGVDMPLESGYYGWDGLARPSEEGGHPVARGFPDRLRSSGRIRGSVEINRSISAGEHSVTPRFILRMKKALEARAELGGPVEE